MRPRPNELTWTSLLRERTRAREAVVAASPRRAARSLPRRRLIAAALVAAAVIAAAAGSRLWPGDATLHAAAVRFEARLTLTRAELPLDAPPTPGDLSDLTRQVLALTQDWPAPDDVVGRGGFIGRVTTGTYRVTPELATV